MAGLLRDKVVWVCGTVLAAMMIAGVVLLQITNHDMQLRTDILLIGNAVSAVFVTIATARGVGSAKDVAQQASDTATDTHSKMTNGFLRGMIRQEITNGVQAALDAHLVVNHGSDPNGK